MLIQYITVIRGFSRGETGPRTIFLISIFGIEQMIEEQKNYVRTGDWYQS
jgi:hypothetical protein